MHSRLYFLILTLSTSACVTVAPNKFTQADELSVVCRDRHSLQFAKAKGIECEFRNHSSGDRVVGVQSVNLPANFSILSPSEVKELHDQAKAEASRRGLNLADIIVGSILALDDHDDIRLLAFVVTVSSALFISQDKFNQNIDYGSLSLAADKKIELRGKQSQKRYLYFDAPNHNLPKSVSLCLEGDQPECAEVPLKLDPIRSRQRSL